MVADKTGHIVLTGPMGSGKTTVGEILAGRLDRSLIDSDEQIEAEHGATGRQLAEAHGVPWLHQAEANALRQALNLPEPSIIAAAASTGDLENVDSIIGGVPVYAVLLTGDADVLAERARSGAHRRKIDVARSHALAERRHRNLADIVDVVIDVTAATPDEVADRILEQSPLSPSTG